ncbi:hypothetical protein [Microbacterium sp. UBA3394]|uniref:hypothetical protein n=1 Tax=Microbacterium sp. UBA3394 TaxID=1946945 RepID=UPI000C3C84CC|nr:hypothetical protein [Microbacterium sp. UBA3394]MAB81642.1 hypothetical protein [Planctomycetota bacterium]MAM53592.1 hypothetical protein [Microbacterium sp.]|tara:strand:+ start:2424 stop:2732 length:309 start_codon:yes stop_codon:yes gene_type:complete
MTHIGPLNSLPIACTLTPSAGKEQIERWRAFDADYALDIEHTDTRLTIHYAKVEDSITRLRELVAAESTCCAFVDWGIEEGHSDLRLVVTGTPEQLAALNVG